MEKPRQLPQATEHEMSVLGSMIINPVSCKTALDQMNPDDFYRTGHSEIFKAIQELQNSDKPIDLNNVVLYLREAGKLNEAGGVPYIAKLTDEIPPPGNLENYIAIIKDKSFLRGIISAANEISNSCFDTTSDSQELIKSAKDAIEKVESDIQKGFIKIDPYRPLLETLMNKYERDMDRDPDKPLGYSLEKFRTLEKNIDGIQPGFYVVGAETNAGKTAFLCNLTLDLLDANPDVTGLYFSLDDNKDVIVNRLLSIKTGVHLNQVQRPQTTERHKAMLQDGYNYLFSLSKDDRLFIRDASEIRDVDDLELEIKRRMSRNLFVVIDGLYNLNIGDIRGDTRQEHIERANKLKALSDTYRIPVICTGELRKKSRGEVDRKPDIDDLMETGKFAYNANLVLLVYPDKWEEYNDSDEPELNLKYAKNKLSHFRGTETVKFVRKTSQIVMI